MSTPLGPSERESLKNINQQLTLMEQKGNFGQLFQVREELQALAQNGKIPPGVQQKLQEALKDLQGAGGQPLTSQNLSKIKSSIDQALKESPETKGPESGQLG